MIAVAAEMRRVAFAAVLLLATLGAHAQETVFYKCTDAKGNVLSGSLTSPGVSYKVTGSGGRINYLTVQGGTTLVTEAAIPVQNGTAAPTTMALSVIGAN